MRKSGSNLKEVELLEGVKNKDNAILEHLYETMTPVVYQDVMNNSGTEDEAKDLFQETMVVVIQNVRDGKYEAQNLKGYIKNVARNIWYKKLRKRDREVALQESNHEQEDHFTYDHYLDLLAYEEEIRKLRQGLQQLGEPCYTVITRFYHEKYTLQAIAEEYNWSYKYCKKRVLECRQCLKHLLG